MLHQAKKLAEEALDKLEESRGDAPLSLEEIEALLAVEDEELCYRLFRIADEVRSRYIGDEVLIRAIIEFSNVCVNNCLYCGLRASNTKLPRYRMKPEEVVKAAWRAADIGFKTVVLQSGEDPGYPADKVAWIVKTIKETTGLAVVLSIGERSWDEYLLYKLAGCDRYLLKHETSNPALYHWLRGKRLEHRLKCLRVLALLGYQAGTGNMIGLPGQSLADLAMDAVLMARLETDMDAPGPFIPNPDTPLGSWRTPPGNELRVFKMIALTRILTKSAHIPVTTGLRTVLGGDRCGIWVSGFRCGANVIMGNVTPPEYRRLYRIYPRKVCFYQDPEEWFHMIREKIRESGLKPSNGHGHGVRTPWKRRARLVLNVYGGFYEELLRAYHCRTSIGCGDPVEGFPVKGLLWRPRYVKGIDEILASERLLVSGSTSSTFKPGSA